MWWLSLLLVLITANSVHAAVTRYAAPTTPALLNGGTAGVPAGAGTACTLLAPCPVTAMSKAYGNTYSEAAKGCLHDADTCQVPGAQCSIGAQNCKNLDGTTWTPPVRTREDVTATIESLLGPIPTACRRDSGTPTPPPTVTAPSTVRVPVNDASRALLSSPATVATPPLVVDRPLP